MEHLFWGSNISAKIIVAKDQSNHTVGVINGEEFLAECACCALKSPYGNSRCISELNSRLSGNFPFETNALNKKITQSAFCLLLSHPPVAGYEAACLQTLGVAH